ncbi:MAG: triose-phosphate isomerase [Pseudomonadota bacterium]
MSIRTLIAGNWKMNGTGETLHEVKALLKDMGDPNCDVLLCPPATLIARMAAMSGRIAIGAQDCHANATGAHTGDISAEMVVDAGGSAVIVGHSERRTDHDETDDMVKAKAEAVLRADLVAIVCVGETEAERDAGKALEVVLAQTAASVPASATAADVVIAYEPVWAIGTGRTPTLADIAEMHDALRAALTERFGDDGAKMRLLYGGSMKPANAAEILALENVNGGLVGGASLKAQDFGAIIKAA